MLVAGALREYCQGGCSNAQEPKTVHKSAPRSIYRIFAIEIFSSRSFKHSFGEERKEGACRREN